MARGGPSRRTCPASQPSVPVYIAQLGRGERGVVQSRTRLWGLQGRGPGQDLDGPSCL